MKKIIYLGMQNTPYEVIETVTTRNFKTVYHYTDLNGKSVMLKSTKWSLPYSTPHKHESHVNKALPQLELNGLYPIDILDSGYSGHDFTFVTI